METAPGHKIRQIERVLEKAMESLSPCRLRPRKCGARRLEGETGFCGASGELIIASDTLHHGEEPAISGTRGSGTLFFSGCNLRCIFCQNYPISQLGHGHALGTHDLALKMIRLQNSGAHNINLVTPSHFVPQILKSLLKAFQMGLSIPLVYNSSGYDSRETLKWLDGIIDIYMPDMKVHRKDTARRLFSAPDYPDVNKQAVLEMARQVGSLQQDAAAIASRGLLIRHLVLPENLADSRDIFHFIASRISKETFVSLMSQYFPAHRAVNTPPLHRRITYPEFLEAEKWFWESGLHNGWIQHISPDP